MPTARCSVFVAVPDACAGTCAGCVARSGPKNPDLVPLYLLRLPVHCPSFGSLVSALSTFFLVQSLPLVVCRPSPHFHFILFFLCSIVRSGVLSGEAFSVRLMAYSRLLDGSFPFIFISCLFNFIFLVSMDVVMIHLLLVFCIKFTLMAAFYTIVCTYAICNLLCKVRDAPLLFGDTCIYLYIKCYFYICMHHST